jgi:peptidyl-prolyl cis-trans isomerase C
MKLACLFLVAFAALPAAAQKPVAPATPLIANGAVVITAEDFEGNMLRIPENLRQESRASLERVSQMSDNLFINRMLAEEARKGGMEKDPLVQARARQIIDAYLAVRYLEEYERNLKMPDLEARAKEIYVSEPLRFRIPESYDIDHIVVSTVGRTRAMALERLKEAEARIQAGEDFLVVAGMYNEASRATGTSGKLGVVTQGSIEPVLFEAAAKLPVGGVSAPIATKNGYHLIKVNAKTPAGKRSFEEARAGIIADERTRIAKKAIEDMIQSFRADPATRVDKEAMEALVADIPRDEINRLHREAAEKDKAAEDARKAAAAKAK